MARTFREIDMFVAVYEQRSFTAAARSKNATQSGVSRTIKILEDSMGVKLLSRCRGAVIPTPAGDQFYKHCVELLKARTIAESSVEPFKQGLAGEVVAGLMPALTRVALGPTLLRFTEENPNVFIRIIQAYSSHLIQQVHAELLDFAVIPHGVATSPYLEIRPFLESTEALVTQRQKDQPAGGVVRLADLPALDLLLPSQGSPRRRQIDLYLSTNRVKVRNTIEIDSITGILSVVKRSNWATILYPLAVADDIDLDVFLVRPIVDPPLRQNISLIKLKKKPLSLAAERFSSVLIAEASKLNSRLDLQSMRESGAGLIGLPPEKRSSVKYGFWPEGGQRNGEEETHG